MKMEDNTDRMHRVLLLWLELNRVAARAYGPGHRRREPWTTDDTVVRNAWERLTDPANLLALEQWLCQSAEGEQAEWARKALQVCRERDKARCRAPGQT